jgi:DNA-binding transcriptional ArsR family regulator
VFTAIADPVRRAILLRLRDGERTVSDIMEPLEVSQSAGSQHLAVLRESGLVRTRREGRHQVYALNADALDEVAGWLRHFDRFWDTRLKRLGQFLDQKPSGRKLS